MKDPFVEGHEKNDVEYGPNSLKIKLLSGKNSDVTLLNVEYISNAVVDVVANRKFKEQGVIIDDDFQLIIPDGESFILLQDIDDSLVPEDNTTPSI